MNPDEPDYTNFVGDAEKWLDDNYNQLKPPRRQIDEADDIIRGLLGYIEQLQKELIT